MIASTSLAMVHFLGTPASRTRIRHATGEIHENRETIQENDTEMHDLMRQHLEQFHSQVDDVISETETSKTPTPAATE